MEEPDFVERVPIPVLMVLAGAETVVSNPAAEALSRRLKTVAHLRIPGARHEILMERDEYRDQFWVGVRRLHPRPQLSREGVLQARQHQRFSIVSPIWKFSLQFVQSSINCALRYSYRSPHWAFPP